MIDPVALKAESLVAVTGLWPTRAPTESNLLAAEALPERWRSRLRRFLRGEQAEAKWTPPPERQAVYGDKILGPLDEQEVTGWLVALGEGDVALGYVATLQAGRAVLGGVWPRQVIGGIVPEALQLSPDDYAEIWAQIRALDETSTLLDDLESWSLSASQITAFLTTYPNLHAMLSEMLTTELVELVVRGRPVSWEVEDMVRVLRNVPPEAPIDIPAPREGSAPAPKRGYEIDFKSTRTPSQAQEARRLAERS